MSAGPLEIHLELVVYTIFTASTNLIDPSQMEGAVNQLKRHSYFPLIIQQLLGGNIVVTACYELSQ
jgi:hypothetical protein